MGRLQPGVALAHAESETGTSSRRRDSTPRATPTSSRWRARRACRFESGARGTRPAVCVTATSDGCDSCSRCSAPSLLLASLSSGDADAVAFRCAAAGDRDAARARCRTPARDSPIPHRVARPVRRPPAPPASRWRSGAAAMAAADRDAPRRSGRRSSCRRISGSSPFTARGVGRDLPAVRLDSGDPRHVAPPPARRSADRRRPSAAAPRSRTLVGSQMGLSLILLVAAGLFLRTLGNLWAQNTGYDRSNVIMFTVDPRLAGRRAPTFGYVPRRARRVENNPGARAVTMSARPAGERRLLLHRVVHGLGGRVVSSRPRVRAAFNHVAPGYFAMLGIPLVAGRDFDERDIVGAPGVAIISERMARHFRESIGQPLERGPAARIVVGVVRTCATQTCATPSAKWSTSPSSRSSRRISSTPRRSEVRAAGSALRSRAGDPRHGVTAWIRG